MASLRWISGLVGAGFLFLAGPATALTLSADLDTGDCFSTDADDCVGGLYTLDVSELGSDRYEARLTMNYGGLYDLDINRNLLMSVDFKVANTYLEPLVLSSAPGGAANWDVAEGPLNAGGCNGNNGGFFCADAISNVNMGSSTSFEYVVQFGLASPDALLAESEWHIGARFGRINPNNGRLNTSLLSASAPNSPIPEPTSYLLFGAGVLVIGGALRKQLLA